jgi:acetyl-CoA carboxylase biotin carboxyl carrier protein
MSELNYQDVIRILNLIDSAGSVDFELVSGDLRLKVSRNADPLSTSRSEPTEMPAPAVTPGQNAAPGATELSNAALSFPDATPVIAPMGGMFYAAPAPGKPPFVEIGQEVRKGDQLGIVEVMKLFTPITAEADGVVVAILVENQQTVAKDDVLMLVQTQG